MSLKQIYKSDIQSLLAVYWSTAVIIWVSYIIYRYGNDKGILNLLIGFMTGSAATIFGFYFMSTMSKKPEPPLPGTTTTISETNLTTVTPKVEDQPPA